MLLLIVSAGVTSVLILVLVYVTVGERSPVEERLEAVSQIQQGPIRDSLFYDKPTGLGRFASLFTGLIKPIRDLVNSNDEELSLQLSLAGFKEPAHIEVFASLKILLPVLGLVASTFASSNTVVWAVVAIAAGFYVPDLILNQLISLRKENIRVAFPDALDLLVICMEAGLGIDQALVRVGQEIKMTSPALSEELQVIMHEQRAGKPRLDAWRSLSDRLDLDFIRQFVTMLVQTERFGTPIANTLGQFSDSLRLRRTQEAEELAAKAGIKLLFPLVIFIFPSIFVVVLGPQLLSLERTLLEISR